jgi:hypothetical protein
MSEITKINQDLPDYLKADIPKHGMIAPDRWAEEQGAERLKIIQGSSSEAGAEGVALGDIYSTSHQASMGKECLFIPIAANLCWVAFSTDRQLLWRVNSPDREEVQAIHEDCRFKFKQWRILVAAPIGSDQYPIKIMELNFGGLSYKPARQWYRELEANQRPMQSLVYRLSAKSEKVGQNTNWFPEFRFAGYADEALFKKCEESRMASAGFDSERRAQGDPLDGIDPKLLEPSK